MLRRYLIHTDIILPRNFFIQFICIFVEAWVYWSYLRDLFLNIIFMLIIINNIIIISLQQTQLFFADILEYNPGPFKLGGWVSQPLSSSYFC